VGNRLNIGGWAEQVRNEPEHDVRKNSQWREEEDACLLRNRDQFTFSPNLILPLRHVISFSCNVTTMTNLLAGNTKLFCHTVQFFANLTQFLFSNQILVDLQVSYFIRMRELAFFVGFQPYEPNIRLPRHHHRFKVPLLSSDFIKKNEMLPICRWQTL
jgi:hypothetical protein